MPDKVAGDSAGGGGVGRAQHRHMGRGVRKPKWGHCGMKKGLERVKGG